MSVYEAAAIAGGCSAAIGYGALARVHVRALVRSRHRHLQWGRLIRALRAELEVQKKFHQEETERVRQGYRAKIANLVETSRTRQDELDYQLGEMTGFYTHAQEEIRHLTDECEALHRQLAEARRDWGAGIRQTLWGGDGEEIRVG